MKLRLGKGNDKKKYTSSHTVREKIKKLAVCAIVLVGATSSILGMYLTSLIPIKDVYIFTNSESKYQIGEVLGTGDVLDCRTRQPLLDENGKRCIYGRGIYWPGTNEKIDFWDKSRLREVGIPYEHANKTYLPDIAGIPLEKVLPEEVLVEVGGTLTNKEVRGISEEIDQYVLEYLKQDQYPTYTCFDHYGQYGVEEESKKCPTLYIYQGVDEKGRKTGEVVVGYATWYNKEEPDESYFHDITNNQLRAIKDKDGRTRYQCVESVRGKKNETDPVTLEELEAKRLRYWEKRDIEYVEDELKPLFGDDFKIVSFDDIEEMALEDGVINAKYNVEGTIKNIKENRDVTYKEQGE